MYICDATQSVSEQVIVCFQLGRKKIGRSTEDVKQFGEGKGVAK